MAESIIHCIHQFYVLFVMIHSEGTSQRETATAV